MISLLRAGLVCTVVRGVWGRVGCAPHPAGRDPRCQGYGALLVSQLPPEHVTSLKGSSERSPRVIPRGVRVDVRSCQCFFNSQALDSIQFHQLRLFSSQEIQVFIYIKKKTKCFCRTSLFAVVVCLCIYLNMRRIIMFPFSFISQLVKIYVSLLKLILLIV